MDPFILMFCGVGNVKVTMSVQSQTKKYEEYDKNFHIDDL